MADAYFDRVATQWDAMRATFFDERVRRAAISAAGVKPGERALDIGAGTGFVAEGLLAAGARVVAVDESAAMVKELARKFGGRLETHQGDGQALPFPDGTFEAALANMYLHHVADPAAAITEAVRVLKPGGSLVITDLDPHAHEFLRREHHDRWMGFARKDVAAWFRQAGLADVAVEDAGGCRCASPARGQDVVEVRIFLAHGTRPADATARYL